MYRGLAGSGDSLGSRTFDLGFLLHNGERNVVVAVVQGGWIGDLAIHYPSLALVLGPDEVLDFCFRGGMAGGQFRLPILVCS